MLLDERTREEARTALSIGPRIPDDTELSARYLGYAESEEDLAQLMFKMDSPHIDTRQWPFAFIDWPAAASHLLGGDGTRALLEIRGHWFDALASTPTVAV